MILPTIILVWPWKGYEMNNHGFIIKLEGYFTRWLSWIWTIKIKPQTYSLNSDQNTRKQSDNIKDTPIYDIIQKIFRRQLRSPIYGTTNYNIGTDDIRMAIQAINRLHGHDTDNWMFKNENLIIVPGHDWLSGLSNLLRCLFFCDTTVWINYQFWIKPVERAVIV